MTDKSFLLDPDHGELFDGPKVFTVSQYATIRLAAGSHNLTLTSERPFMVAIIPEQEVN